MLKSNPVIRFRQGDYLTSNTSLTNIDPASKIYASSSNGNSVHVFIQFRKIPTQIQKESLIGKGIELIEYIPGNTFLASVNTFVSSSDLKTLGVLQVIPVKPNYKIDKVLAGIFEKNSLSGFQTSVLISAFPNSNTEDLVASLKFKGISISPFKDGFKGLFIATVSSLHMNQLLEDPFVYFVESLPEADKSLNMESGVLHNSSTFHSAYSGKYLTGKGVIIGIGDDGQLNLHIDNYYKVIENLNFPTDHATHVAGIATGSGNLNPRLKGQAPEAKVIDESFSGILSQTPQYFQNYGMVLTNNSYGSDGRCTNSGAYSPYPGLLTSNCSIIRGDACICCRKYKDCHTLPSISYWLFFNLPSYQSSKNAISVGGSDKFNPSNFYSKGPTNDGRIKPEIVAVGNSVLSTGGNNNYYNNFGTSMAAPQVTGVMALMVERYRQLNAGANPKGALLKTIVCNSSDDIGNTGPDYANGYGWLNAAKAVECIEKKQYAPGSIQQDEIKTFSLAVSNNTAELKVAAYWPDKPASLFQNNPG
ncbi:MAG: S8 family serine peptidase [Chitinophagaceae bacterium]|nr:S8 family serine peptidase [Chitinophagaceae bacterium]